MKRAMLVLAVAACGPPGNAIGTVSGTQLAVRETHFVTPLGAPVGSGAQIFLTDYPGACTAAPSPFSLKGVTVMDFVVVNPDAGTLTPLVVGDYPVVSRDNTPRTGPSVNVHFSKLDNTCSDTLAGTGLEATAGSVHLSMVSATSIKGSFDVTFDTGHLTGDFGAVSCTPPSEMGFTCN